MKLIVVFIFCFSCLVSSAQKKIYRHQEMNTLYEEYTFYEDGRFDVYEVSEGIIQYSGRFTKSHDTLYLVQATPLVMNKIDTDKVNSPTKFKMIEYSSMFLTRGDEFYALQKVYEGEVLREEHSWMYIDTTFYEKKEFPATLYMSYPKDYSITNRHIRGYPLKNGTERYYDSSGDLIKECEWKAGLKKKCFDYK
jgi:hypothetical protein